MDNNQIEYESNEVCPYCNVPLPENDQQEAQCEHGKHEWWERAVWECPSCDFFKIRMGIDDMYHYSGICPRCESPMFLVSIEEDIPF